MTLKRIHLSLTKENVELARKKGWDLSDIFDKHLAKLLVGTAIIESQDQRITGKEAYLAGKVAEHGVTLAAHTKVLRQHGDQIKILRRIAGLPEVDTK